MGMVRKNEPPPPHTYSARIKKRGGKNLPGITFRQRGGNSNTEVRRGVRAGRAETVVKLPLVEYRPRKAGIGNTEFRIPHSYRVGKDIFRGCLDEIAFGDGKIVRGESERAAPRRILIVRHDGRLEEKLPQRQQYCQAAKSITLVKMATHGGRPVSGDRMTPDIRDAKLHASPAKVNTIYSPYLPGKGCLTG